MVLSNQPSSSTVRFVVASITFLVCVLPSAAAFYHIDSRFQFTTSSAVELSLNQTYSGDLAQQWRRAADTNGDGNLTSDEVRTRPPYDPRPSGAKFLMTLGMDGHGPRSQAIVNSTSDNVLGPVNRTDALTNHAVLQYTFILKDDPMHTFTMESNEGFVIVGNGSQTAEGTSEILVTMPAGYEISRTTNLGAHADATATTVHWDFNATRDFQSSPMGVVSIMFGVPGGTGGRSPATGLVGMTIGLFAIAWMRRTCS